MARKKPADNAAGSVMSYGNAELFGLDEKLEFDDA